MAQTGFTPIQLYRSVTAATAPLAADLAAGELALNTTDEKLYFKNTGGTAKILANAAIAGTLFSQAKKGNTAAAIFWLKTRARWKETQVNEVTGANGSDLRISWADE